MSIPSYKPVWRCADAATERDVLAFWRENNLLPNDADAAKRLKDICLVVYDDARLVAVLEAEVRYLDAVRAKIAMLQPAVAASHRRAGVAGLVLAFARPVIETWSAQHPEEKVMGIGGVIQTKHSDPQILDAVWTRTRMMIVSHTQKGEQVRLAWFRNAKVDESGPGD